MGGGGVAATQREEGLSYVPRITRAVAAQVTQRTAVKRALNVPQTNDAACLFDDQYCLFLIF